MENNSNKAAVILTAAGRVAKQGLIIAFGTLKFLSEAVLGVLDRKDEK